jgi:cytochrome b
MILALMACVIALGVTGWLYTTDRFWGDETVETVHRAFAWTLYALVPLHVAGVVFTGVRQRENLVRAMLTGRKPAAKEGDVD